MTGETPSPVSPWALAFLSLFLQPFAFGQAGEFSLQEKSEPEGLFPTVDRNVTANTEVLTLAPSLSKNGYAFTHWTINGVRQADANGQALNRLNLNLSANTVALAHYLNETIDSDDDGVMDWYELRHFGSLQRNRSHDGDGDGISLAKERRFGLNPSIEDDVTEGGVSIRRSGKVFMNFGGGSQLIVKSDPPGLVATVGYLPETNSTYTTNVLSGKDNGYVFSHWEANGVRRSDSQGAGLNRITETISEDTDLVAKYYHEDEDSDGDGVPDWFEWHEFGNLAKDASDDADGDGFTLDQERRYDLNPNVFDQIAEGGFSMRMAGKVNFTSSSTDANGSLDSDGDGLTNAQEASLGLDPHKADTDGDGFNDGVEVSEGSNANDPLSLANYSPSNLELNGTSVAENQPSGTVVGIFLVTDPDANSSHVISFTEGNGSQHNNLFSIDAGILKTAAKFDYETNTTTLRIRVKANDEYNASLVKTFVISVTNVLEDLDGDGIEDHYDTDDDGDGFSDATEIAYGSDPKNAQSVANQAPTLLNLNGTSIAENSNAVSVVGILSATDPDTNATITIAFADGNGSQHNHLFTLDTNDTLKTTATFDYETNATSLNIRVKATDEHNASIEKVFAISVTNVVEDFDSDGIEDHYDPDDDNDGFSDAEEVTAGTNPLDPVSVPNHSPTAITLNNLRVAEGRPAGDLVARVGISDPDDVNGTGIYAYALVDGNGSSGNGTFTLDENGTLRTAQVLDHESNASQTIRIQVKDEHNASMEKSFVIEIIDLPEAGQAQPAPTMPELPNWLSEAQPAGVQAPGWYASDWFGSFHRTTSPWLYQADLGWIYAVDDGTGNNGWLWLEGHGWLWTGQGLYRYLYRSRDGIWLYFLKRKNGQPHFYNQATKQVE